MGEKKKPGRFTLQFNLEDPQQQTVSELLEQQGRHKAQFLTSAVLYYIQNSGSQGHGSRTPAVDETILEQILLSIMEKRPDLLTLPPDRVPGVEETPKRVFPAMRTQDSIGIDAMAAISETLAAFQQE